jgi:glutamyl-tRNA synthetase
MRTTLVGYTLTMADIACWGALTATMQWDGLRNRGAVPHLARYYEFLMGSIPELLDVALEYGPVRKGKGALVNASSEKKGKKEKDDNRPRGADGPNYDIGLKDATEGKVVTRFPPEPSGYLHIGHAKAALLNQYFATMYKGKLLVRFDDTNPSKENDEYVQSIIKDMSTLGLKFDKITYTSDYFPEMMDLAEKMITAGDLYADDTPVEKMREERMHGVESACRSGRSVEDNMRLFHEMIKGSEEGLKNCMRIKLDMTAANKALRDPVAWRCNLVPHWRTGEKYKVYPTYDFACPFVDSFEGVTHALRTSEYKDREPQFYWILKLQQKVWNVQGGGKVLEDVHIWDYSRLSFVHTVLSKRKLTWFVQNKMVDGWTDPRMPTVQGMLRRGLQVEALREFILSQGASKNVTVQEWDKIWTINKKLIDPVCPRHTAVEVDNRVLVAMEGGPAYPSGELVEMPRHQKYPPAGTKMVLRSNKLWLDQVDAADLAEGEEATLMGWGNAIFTKKTVAPAGDGGNDIVTAMEGKLHLEGDFKKTRLKITWLAETDLLIPLELHYFGYLINKRKIEEDDNFEDHVNRDSRKVVKAVGDANMKELKKGDVIQLERKGYFIVDVPLGSGTDGNGSIILFNIPDGKAKNMGSLSW